MAIRPEQLGDEINRQLTLYHEDIIKRVNNLSKEAAHEMVKMTRASAPVGARGAFASSISSKRLSSSMHGDTYVWYVKKPNYRLTHLLAKGHAKRNGGRTRADPFLRDAIDTILPKYEEDVKEACKG